MKFTEHALLNFEKGKRNCEIRTIVFEVNASNKE